MGAAVLIVVLLVGAFALASSGKSGPDRSTSSVSNELAGIPQKGRVLGYQDAPVLLVEYGDLRCSACALVANTKLPTFIDEQVRTGKVKIEFRNYVVLGDESEEAAQASLAAAEQGRYWQFVNQFYANQPDETESLTDEFLAEVAENAGIKDIGLWEERRSDDDRWRQEIERVKNDASRLGFVGTPSFATAIGAARIQRPTDLNAASNVGDFEAVISEAALAGSG